MKTPKKTDESVKAGLEIAAHSKPVDKEVHVKITKDTEHTEKEIDGDDQVHEQNSEVTDEDEEHDQDELVHEQGKAPPVNEDEENDIDDLLHRGTEDDDKYFSNLIN